MVGPESLKYLQTMRCDRLHPRMEEAIRLREEEGVKTYVEMGRRMGVTRVHARKLYLLGCEIRNRQGTDPLFGLNTRARRILADMGLNTPEAIRKAASDGTLHPDIYGYGYKTHRHICEWVGVEPPPPPGGVVCPCCKARFILNTNEVIARPEES